MPAWLLAYHSDLQSIYAICRARSGPCSTQEFVAEGKKGKGKERKEEEDDEHEEKKDEHEEKEDENEEMGHEEEGNEDDDVVVVKDRGPANAVLVNCLASPIAAPHLFGGVPDTASVSSRSLSQQTRSVSWGRTFSQGGRGSKLHSMLTSVSNSPVAIGEDDTMAPLVAMTGKKLDRQIAEQSAKHAKYESVSATANAEMEREKLVSQERLLKMQHECEREKEAHQIRLLQMQYAMRRPAQSDLLLSDAEPSHVRPSMQHNPFGIGPSNVGPSMQHDLGVMHSNAGLSMQHDPLAMHSFG